MVTLTIHYLLFTTHQTYAGGPGTTGAQFLKLGIGARPGALGETFVGIADDINSIYWNPAGLTNLESLQITLSGSMLYENIYYGFLSVGGSIGSTRSFGLSVIYLGMDTIKGYDKDGNPTPDYDYTANDIAIGIGHGRKLGKNISLGVTVKSIQQKIAEATTNGLAFDFGGLYELEKISLGLVVQNIGTQIGFNEKFDLPLNLRLGAGYKATNSFILATDLNFPIDYTPNLHLGAEYIYKRTLALRMGLKTTTIYSLGVISGLSAGIGLKIKNLNLDYAILPYGDLGLTHRISLLVSL